MSIGKRKLEEIVGNLKSEGGKKTEIRSNHNQKEFQHGGEQ